MLFDYETMGMRSISVMSCMIWIRNSSRHTSNTPLPPIHHHCVINYPGRPTNVISLLLFPSFIVVIGAFCWGWISFLLRCCHGHCQIDYDLTGTAVSWLPLYSNGTRVFYALYGSNDESWFQIRVVRCFMLSFIRIGSRETKIWCGFLLHFHLQTGLVMVFFFFFSRRWFIFIVFAQCSYILGGYLSFFLVICRVHADVYMLGSLTGGFVIFFSVYHLRKGGRLISFCLFPIYARCPCFIVFFFSHVLDIKPGRLSD